VTSRRMVDWNGHDRDSSAGCGYVAADHTVCRHFQACREGECLGAQNHQWERRAFFEISPRKSNFVQRLENVENMRKSNWAL